jgi:nucleoside-diphosphate-sugar epimerase
LRIAVTGSSGFYGSHLIPRLLSLGHTVVGIDTVHPQDSWRLNPVRDHPNLSLYWGALTDSFPYIPPVDVAIHAAAVTDVAYASRNPRQSLFTTVESTVALALAARSNWTKRVVLISTHSVYGPQNSADPIREHKALLNPSNLYGALKASQEMVLRSAAHEHGVPLTVLRMSLMYGEQERAGALVSHFIKTALRGGTIQLHGGGAQTRDFNYVGNAVDACLASLSPDEELVRTFNICSGENVSIRRLAELSVEFAGDGVLIPTPPRAGEEGDIKLSYASAEVSLDYRPTVLFEEGFRRTAEWVRENGL